MFHQEDFDGFSAIVPTGRTAYFAVFGPAKPSEVLGMNAVVHVVAAGNVARELDLDCLHGVRHARGTRHGAVCHPVLPTHVGAMRAVANAAVCVGKGDLKGFDGACFARCSDRCTVLAEVELPALVADVRRVLNGRGGYRLCFGGWFRQLGCCRRGGVFHGSCQDFFHFAGGRAGGFGGIVGDVRHGFLPSSLI